MIASGNQAIAGSRERPAGSLVGALGGLALAMLLSSLGTSIANVALPTLAQEFGASFQDVQWVVLAYLLAVTALIVGVGRLGDLIGRRRLLVWAIGLFTLASGLCAIAPNLWSLVAARGLQGLGAAGMMALTMAFVGAAVPRESTGRVMGLLGTMSALGTALGPSLGGLLIAGPGWPAIFLANLPLGMIALILAWRFLPADRQSQDAPIRFDVAGTLVLAGTLAAYALSMTLGRGEPGLINLALLIAAISGLGLFVLVERRSDAPLVRLGMLGPLGRSLAASGLVATVMMATLVVGPFYLARVLGLDAATVGLVVSVGPAVVALAGVPAGRLTDRFGARRIMILGLAGILAGSVLLSGLPAALGIPGYVGPLVVVTAGYALFQTANNTLVMADVPQDRRGTVSGLLNLSRNLGLVTGASAMGAVFALGSGAADVATAAPEPVGRGMAVTFAVAALLAAFAILLALGSSRRDGSH